MENAIRQKAKELLEKGEVKVVVGYGLNKRRDRSTPGIHNKAGGRGKTRV